MKQRSLSAAQQPYLCVRVHPRILTCTPSRNDVRERKQRLDQYIACPPPRQSCSMPPTKETLELIQFVEKEVQSVSQHLTGDALRLEAMHRVMMLFIGELEEAIPMVFTTVEAIAQDARKADKGVNKGLQWSHTHDETMLKILQDHRPQLKSEVYPALQRAIEQPYLNVLFQSAIYCRRYINTRSISDAKQDATNAVGRPKLMRGALHRVNSAQTEKAFIANLARKPMSLKQYDHLLTWSCH